MTVLELIKELEQYPKDMEVVSGCCECLEFEPRLHIIEYDTPPTLALH
jgi:hypothetical protein